jgi:hypothetical protein
MSEHTPPREPIRELELTRAPNDRHHYHLHGIGTIRRDGGMFSTSFIAESAGHSWRFTRRGILRQQLEATTSDGTVVGMFLPKTIRRGGLLDWDTRSLTLHPASLGRERYALREADRDVIFVEGKSWGRRPVKLTLIQPGGIDPGLVLFTAYVVHRLAIDAASMAGSVAATTASTSAAASS